MKSGLLLAASLLVGVMGYGQVKSPDLSPEAELEQMIGLTEVEIEYSRPSMRERQIFGDLIPYDKLWRTGANKNSTISVSTDFEIEGKQIEKGEYAIFVKPSKKSWMVYLYADTENWGLPSEWDESKVVASFETVVTKIKPTVETFTIHFENLTTESADLSMAWENVKISLALSFPTDALTEASIKETMQSGEVTERDYYGAATYYLNADKNLKDALAYINKAIEAKGEDAFWYVRKKALIEYKLGMTDEAIATAKKSLAAAKKAENESYVKMNQESIDEWSK
jgi:tetratricopeptide (TPR) repeat protein